MHLSVLCESNDISYPALMEAVEEFVDSVAEEATVELYEATAKRILGESLTHAEIMMGVPICGPDDLIILEKVHPLPDDAPNLTIATDTQIKVLLSRLKLGRKGLLQLYKSFLEMEKKYPNKTPQYQMGKAGSIHGLELRQSQLILTKMIRKHNTRVEHYLNMAESALLEEVPTNTQGSAMPDHDASDSKPRKKKTHKRKKLDNIDESSTLWKTITLDDIKKKYPKSYNEVKSFLKAAESLNKWGISFDPKTSKLSVLNIDQAKRLDSNKFVVIK